MDLFLQSNEWQWRFARTVVQGVLAVVVANLDLLVGACVVEPAWRALAVALVMAVLSPVMAELGACEGASGAVGGGAGGTGGGGGVAAGSGGAAGGGGAAAGSGGTGGTGGAVAGMAGTDAATSVDDLDDFKVGGTD